MVRGAWRRRGGLSLHLIGRILSFGLSERRARKTEYQTDRNRERSHIATPSAIVLFPTEFRARMFPSVSFRRRSRSVGLANCSAESAIRPSKRQHPVAGPLNRRHRTAQRFLLCKMTRRLRRLRGRQKPFEEAIDGASVDPAHHRHQVVLAVHIDHVGAVADMGKRCDRAAAAPRRSPERAGPQNRRRS